MQVSYFSSRHFYIANDAFNKKPGGKRSWRR